jgi:mRNA interferase MazF
MARILTGDVLRADLNPVRGHEQGGQRPVVVISEDVFNLRSGTVIAMAITRQPQNAGFPLSGVKLPKQSWVKISQVRFNVWAERSAAFRRKCWISSLKA